MSKTTFAALVVLASLAGTSAYADKKLDDAIAKAEEQLQKGKPEEALKTLQKAASQASADPDAQLALARMNLRLGNRDDAGTGFQKAVDVSASAAPGVRARALAALAEFKLRSGATREALTLADQAAQAEPSALALAAQARAQARLQIAGALATAERAVQAGAGVADAHAAQGEALLAARQATDAVAAFRRALERDPKHVGATVGLCQALLQQGKLAEAVAEGRKATEWDQHSGEAYAALGLALIAQDPTDKTNDAIAQAQQGAFLEPKNPTVKLAVGRIFESRGQLDQAVASYRDAGTLDPTASAPRLAAISLQYRKGDLDGALAEIRKLPAELQQSGEIALLLGKLLVRKDDYVNAVPALERAAKALAGLAEAHATLGTALYNTGDLEKAVAAYKRAVELEPGNDNYLGNYGLFLGYAGKLDEGIAAMEKVTSKPGYKDLSGFINLGWLYRSSKPPRVAESVGAYRKALRVDPKNGQAALGIALAYSFGKSWDEAIAAYNEVSRIDPKLTGEAMNGIAWCWFFKKDMAQARAFLDKASAAGRPEAGGLRETIDKFEKAAESERERLAAQVEQQQREREQGPGLGALVAQLQSNNPAAQARAARALMPLGRPAVAHLAYALTTGTHIGAREIIVSGLGSMGSSAREALPILDRLVAAGPPPPNPDATAEQMANEVRETRLLAAMRSAAIAIRR